MPFACFGKNKNTFDISSPSSSSDRDSFFVVTAIFNPAGFTSRYDLYHKFAQHMQSCGVQLMTVEAIFPSLGQSEFQVTKPENPLHVQVTSNSVYWMKENLINLGVARLPSHAKWVAWLDADLTFLSKNWVKETISTLQRYEVVQVFKKAKFLGPPPSCRVLRKDYSFGYSVVHNKIIDQSRYAEWYPHPGYGWAMSITSFRAMGGLPIHDIVGSGDLHFAFSLLNKVSNALEDELHPEFKEHVLQASRHTFETLSNLVKINRKSGGLVGYTPVTICHNWHGSRGDRQYVDRWKILIAHQFNFSTDVINVTIPGSGDGVGLLEFVGPKGNALQADILAHFRIRKEDGKQISGQDMAVVSVAAGMALKHKKKKKKGDSSSSSSDSDKDRDYRMRMAQIHQQPDPPLSPGCGDRGEWLPGCPCPTHPDCPPNCDHCPPGTHPGHGEECHSPGGGGDEGYPGGDGGHYDSIHTSTQY